jgi:hypothetical protein
MPRGDLAMTAKQYRDAHPSAWAVAGWSCALFQGRKSDLAAPHL